MVWEIMKKLFFIFFLSIVFSGCKRTDESVYPDAEIKWFVASTGIATIITYCKTLYGDISQGDGLICINDSIERIPDNFFDDQLVLIKRECSESGGFLFCISRRTNEISDIIYKSIIANAR